MTRLNLTVEGRTEQRFATIVAQAIGIERIRQECAHLDQWLSRLEKLAN